MFPSSPQRTSTAVFSAGPSSTAPFSKRSLNEPSSREQRRYDDNCRPHSLSMCNLPLNWISSLTVFSTGPESNAAPCKNALRASLLTESKQISNISVSRPSANHQAQLIGTSFIHYKISSSPTRLGACLTTMVYGGSDDKSARPGMHLLPAKTEVGLKGEQGDGGGVAPTDT